MAIEKRCDDGFSSEQQQSHRGCVSSNEGRGMSHTGWNEQKLIDYLLQLKLHQAWLTLFRSENWIKWFKSPEIIQIKSHDCPIVVTCRFRRSGFPLESWLLSLESFSEAFPLEFLIVLSSSSSRPSWMPFRTRPCCSKWTVRSCNFHLGRSHKFFLISSTFCTSQSPTL